MARGWSSRAVQALHSYAQCVPESAVPVRLSQGATVIDPSHEHEWHPSEFLRDDIAACSCGAMLVHGQVFYPAWEWLSTPEGTVTLEHPVGEAVRKVIEQPTPPRSGVRCPNPEPHEPHQYAVLAEGITVAGGLCDPAQWPSKASPPRRLRACVEAWPECQEGEYNPKCCRFPKSCSCIVYDEQHVTEAELEDRPRG